MNKKTSLSLSEFPGFYKKITEERILYFRKDMSEWEAEALANEALMEDTTLVRVGPREYLCDGFTKLKDGTTVRKFKLIIDDERTYSVYMYHSKDCMKDTVRDYEDDAGHIEETIDEKRQTLKDTYMASRDFPGYMIAKVPQGIIFSRENMTQPEANVLAKITANCNVTLVNLGNGNYIVRKMGSKRRNITIDNYLDEMQSIVSRH